MIEGQGGHIDFGDGDQDPPKIHSWSIDVPEPKPMPSIPVLCALPVQMFPIPTVARFVDVIDALGRVGPSGDILLTSGTPRDGSIVLYGAQRRWGFDRRMYGSLPPGVFVEPVN